MLFLYLPGRVSDLATGLSYVNGDDFAHDEGTDDGSGVFGVRTMMMADLTLLVIFVGG
jgi:hypothetical protein